jgi:hypothetical protein
MVARSLNATFVADGHVRRDQDRGVFREVGDLGALRGAEPGGADDRAGAGSGDELEMRERGFRHGELDQHPIACDLGRRVGADVDAGLADAGQLARVTPDRRVAGRLERGDQAQIGRIGQARDDPIAHPAGGPRDNDVRRRGAPAPDARGCLPAGCAHGAAT